MPQVLIARSCSLTVNEFAAFFDEHIKAHLRQHEQRKEIER